MVCGSVAALKGRVSLKFISTGLIPTDNKTLLYTSAVQIVISKDQKILDKKFENTLSTLIDRKDNNFAIKKERLILHQWSLYAKRRK